MALVRDVVIVGAGLLGLAAGRALAARGRDVVILEQAEIGHSGSGSKGSCRIFRVGYPDPGYVAAARQARDRWHELEAASGRRILHPAPQLTFGIGLHGVRDAMTAAGAACELLSAAEAASRFPAIRTGGPALLEPDSAVIAADAALAALAAGVPEIRTGVRVTRLADDGRQVRLWTSAGPVTARAAIIAAGPWSGGLLASLGVPMPARPTLEQVAYLRRASPGGDAHPAKAHPADAHPADAHPGEAHTAQAHTGQVQDGESRMPIFIRHAEQAPYGLPVPGSPLYKIGIHPSGPATDPDAQDPSADQRLLSRFADMARRYLPDYEPEPVITERCIYDNSPDEDFVMDRIGNVVVGCGTSGHGFKFGPLLGEWLASMASGAAPASGATDSAGVPDPQLRQRFAIGRFGRPD